MPNRTQAPALSSLSDPQLLDYTHETLSNGAQLYVLNDPAQAVFKLDVSFDAGTFYQPQPLTAAAAVNMLNEGTRRRSSADIAELFDYYGAYVDFSCGAHEAEINLLSLTKYARECIDLLGEIVTESTFPGEELEIWLKNRKQSFLREREKTAWLARREFLRLLFGAAHPYANRVEEEDYDKVTIDTIVDFYKKRYYAKNCKIIFSGNISGAIFDNIKAIFGRLDSACNVQDEKVPALTPAAPGRYHVEKEGSVQSSVRIGQKGVRISEEDYTGFQLLNTVLGGYFGSRLMSVIREEKGYTYGIQSFNADLPMAAYWCISSDVNKEFTEPVIKEVINEIKKLQTIPVSEQELLTVKNYLYGELLRELDGVFAQADALKHKLTFGLDNNYYLYAIGRIKEITPEKLRELANKYWDTDNLYIVTVG